MARGVEAGGYHQTAGASVAGRFGPDQSGVIHAQAWASGPSTGGITITFVLASGSTSRYGKLGNLDRVFLAHGRTLGGVLVGSGQGFQWSAGSGASFQFANGDNNTKYHVTLDFTQTLLDKNATAVPMSDCRKMYMVFAPRFENVEQHVQDGCFLTAGVGTSDTTWTVNDSSKLTGGRYFIGTSNLEERIQLLSVVSETQINVTRGFEASTPGGWSAGARLKKVSPVSGFNGDVEWGYAISSITVTGDGSLKVGGGSDRIGSRKRTRAASTPALGRTTRTRAASDVRPPACWTFARLSCGTRTRGRTISISGRSSIPTAARSASRSIVWRPHMIST